MLTTAQLRSPRSIWTRILGYIKSLEDGVAALTIDQSLTSECWETVAVHLHDTPTTPTTAMIPSSEKRVRKAGHLHDGISDISSVRERCIGG